MRRLLRSWLLFAAVWIPAHALVAVFVGRRIALTQAAFWSAALVPLVQAIAVESLARPLFGESWRAVVAAVGRSGALRLLWGAVAIAIGLYLWALGAAPSDFPQRHVIVPRSTALFVLLAAALLAKRAWRRRPGVLAAAAAFALGIAAAIIAPDGMERLVRFLGPPATVRFLVIAGTALLAATLALSLGRRLPELSARFFEGAAGAAIGAGVAGIIPATLGIPLDATRALPVHVLVTIAAAAAASGALCAGEAERAA
jgi:hypothetical protein